MGYLEELKDMKCTPPAEAFTAEDARLASGLGAFTVRSKLKGDVALGRLETGTFLVRGHKTQYFWEAKNAKVRKR